MKQPFLIVILLFLSTIALGQKKYKHEYREYLKPQPSTYTTETTDTLIDLGKSVLTFQLQDNRGDAVYYTNLTIKNSTTDTTIYSDMNGFASITLPSGNYSISMFSYPHTPVDFVNLELEGSKETTIKTSLGESNIFRIALIYSRRKLTKEEIENLVDDLSFDRGENELITNKTCYISWEI